MEYQLKGYLNRTVIILFPFDKAVTRCVIDMQRPKRDEDIETIVAIRVSLKKKNITHKTSNNVIVGLVIMAKNTEI